MIETYRRIKHRASACLSRLITGFHKESTGTHDPETFFERQARLRTAALHGIARHAGRIVLLADLGPVAPGDEQSLLPQATRVADAIMQTEVVRAEFVLGSVHLPISRDAEGQKRQLVTEDLVMGVLASRISVSDNTIVYDSGVNGVFPSVAEVIERRAREMNVSPSQLGHVAVIPAMDMMRITGQVEPDGTALLVTGYDTVTDNLQYTVINDPRQYGGAPQQGA